MPKHPSIVPNTAKQWCAVAALTISLSAPVFARDENTTSSQAKPALPNTQSTTAQASEVAPDAQKALEELERHRIQLAPATPQVGGQPSTQDKSAPDLVPQPTSLTLFDAEEMALKNNHTLQVSKYQAQVAHEQLGQWMSKVYPHLSLSAGLTHSDSIDSHPHGTIVNTTTTTTVVDDSDTGSSSRTSLSVTLSARQTLFDLSRRPSLRRAELNEVSELAALEGVRQDVLLLVREAWFTAYIDSQLLEIGQQTLENKRKRLKQAEGLYLGGTKARIDVATAQTDLANAQVAVIKLETQLMQDWVNLNVAMGLRSAQPYKLTINPYWDYATELDSEALVRVAFTHRTELQALQAQLRSQIAYLDIVKADKCPTISASASLAGSGAVTPMTGTWSLGLALDWNIFDGFLNEYQHSEAKAQAHALAEKFYQQQMLVYKEVNNRIVLYRQSQAAIPVAETALSAAQESYRLASARYAVGVAETLEVADAELALSEAQSDLAVAYNTFRTSKAELIRVLGIDDLDNLPAEALELKPDTIPQ